jgi:Zn ribbon nucleic-acid-binding protein
MKFYSSLLLPKRQKIALLRPLILSLFDMRLKHTFSRLLKTSGLTDVGKKNALNIVQMKRNGSNCPTGRNLDKLSLKMREESHVMRESKQKCGYFTVIAGNLEGLHHTAKYALDSVHPSELTVL